MKVMILVLSPRESRDLLNGNLSVLVCKHFPKDYVGQVYIYCMKGKPYLFKDLYAEKNGEEKLYYVDNKEHDSWSQILNGKVIAKIWCDKTEGIKFRCLTKTNTYGVQRTETTFTTQTLSFTELKKLSCLTRDDLMKNLNDTDGVAVHITKPEPFDEPKEIGEFYKVGYYKAAEEVYRDNLDDGYDKDRAWAKAERSVHNDFALTRVPRSGWCYIEV